MTHLRRALFAAMAIAVHAPAQGVAQATVAEPVVLEPLPPALNVRSGEKLALPLKILNQGGEPATWQLEMTTPSGSTTELEDVLAGFIARGPALISDLPTLSDFPGGETGSQIDGSNLGTPFGTTNPFSGGNLLRTDLGGPIAYSNRVIASSPALGSDGRYFTLKLPGLFILCGDADGPVSFESYGMGFASHVPYDRSFTLSHAGRTWSVHCVTRGHGGSQRAVQQITLVDDAGTSITPHGPGSTSNLSCVVRLAGKRRIIHATFGSPASQAPSHEAMNRFARSLLDSVPDLPSSLSVSPSGGELAPAGVASTVLTLDATGLLPGDYLFNIDLVSGDTRIRKEVTLKVDPPELSLAKAFVKHAGVQTGPSETLDIPTLAATPVTWRARLIGGGDWISLTTPEGESGSPLGLRLTPVMGSFSRDYFCTVEITTDRSTTRIPVSYLVDRANITGVFSSTKSDRAYALHNGIYGGAVLVLDPLSGDIVKTIQVPRGPFDLDFSPDEPALHVISGTEVAISKIDLRSHEAVASVHLESTQYSTIVPPRVAAGREGRIYFTDSSPNPKLQLLRFPNPEIVDVLLPSSLPPAGSQQAGVGDVHYDTRSGTLLVTRRQYSTGFPGLAEVDPAGDRFRFIAEYAVAVSSETVSPSSRILADPLSERVFFSRSAFPRRALAEGKQIFPDPMLAISGYGDLVASQGKVEDPLHGTQLATHPGGSLFAFTPDQTGLVYHNASTRRFQYWPLPAEIVPPPPSIRPTPRDGFSLQRGEDTIRWTPLPETDAYRIYLGEDRQAVAAAQPGSPLDRGLVDGTSFALEPLLPSGNYFWRIDAISGDQVIPGTVFAFGIAPFTIHPGAIDLKAPVDALPQPFRFEATDGSGTLLPLTISSAMPWIRASGPTAAGGPGATALLDAAGLAAGIYKGALGVSHGGFTIEVPVTFRLFQPLLDALVPDPVRPVVYGLHWGTSLTDPGYVVGIDATTGRLIRSWHFDSRRLSMALHAEEDRLYVPAVSGGKVNVIDLASGDPLPPLNITGVGEVGVLVATRKGRLFIQDRSDQTSFHLYDTENQSNLGNFRSLTAPFDSTNTKFGSLYRADRQRLFRIFPGGLLQTIDVSTDSPTLVSSVITSSLHPVLYNPWIAMSLAGDRVFTNSSVRSADLRPLAMLPEESSAASRDGQVFATSTAIHWTDGVAKIADLPPNLQSVVFSHDDRHLVAWDKVAKRVVSLRVDTLVDLPGPFPRPEQHFDSPPPSLSWSPVPGASFYEIYLGSSASAVSDALRDSPQMIGSSSQANFPLPAGLLAPGSRVYWRIDAFAPTGQPLSKGTTFWFDVGFTDLVIDPGPSPTALGEFSQLTDHSFIVGGSEEARLFDFDQATGTSGFRQAIPLASVNPAARNSGLANAVNTAFDGRQVLFGLPQFGKSQSSQDLNQGKGYAYGPDRLGIWQRVQDIVPPPTAVAGRQFGAALAFSDGLALIGEGGTTGARGTVHAYLPDSGWLRTASFQAADGFVGDLFGATLALDGNRAVIGSPDHFNGPKARALVFEHDPRTRAWNQVATLAPAANLITYHTARALAIQGDTAAIANLDSFSHQRTASVVLFNAAAGWKQGITIRARDVPGASGYFGTKLQLDGDLLFVGDPRGTWKNSPAGVVWVFRIEGDAWSALPPITPEPTNAAVNFGRSISARDGWLLVGGTSITSPPLLVQARPQANRRPRFTSPPLGHLAAGAPFDLPVGVIDPDGDEVTISLIQAPEWLELRREPDGTIRISGTDPQPASPMPLLQIEVRDPRGGRALQTTELRVLVNPAMPQITGLPAVQEAGVGQDLTLRPLVTGASPLSYQWHLKGKALPGETGPVLHLRELSPDDSGPYSLVATNPAGSVESSTSVLTVRPADRFAGDWTTFGGNEGRSGHHPATLGRHRWVKAWNTPPVTGFSPLRPAIAGGRIHTTAVQNGSAFAAGWDLKTGAELWRLALASSNRSNLTHHDDHLYFQLTASSSHTLRALDAVHGTQIWAAPYQLQGGTYEAPAVSESGAFAGGGSFSGMYGFNLDGIERFFIKQPQVSSWTPTIHKGRLFSWITSEFTEYGAGDGVRLWSLVLGSQSTSNKGKAAIIAGDSAAVLGDRLYCIDLPSRSLRWSVLPADTTYGDPAIDRDSVHVINRLGASAYSLATGALIRHYRAGEDLSQSGNRPIGQALVFNDHIAFANPFKTWIFHRDTAELITVLPVGGSLAYSNGHLVVATSTHLEAWFANGAPKAGPGFQPQITAAPDAPDGLLPLGDSILDTDPGETLAWSILSVSRPEVFRTLEIDPGTGDLAVIYNPWQSGSSEVTLRIIDGVGNVTDTVLTFTVPAHPAPALLLAEKLVLNRQTGLYEHVITITNSAAREVAGFDLAITGLPTEVILNNASDNDGTTWTVEHRKPLAAGASVTLVLEYYTPARGTVINPRVAVRLVTEPESDPAAGNPGLAVDRCEVLADGLLIEFTTVPGRLYEIQYSDDTRHWKVSPIRIRAAGNRTQWIDRGPPRTDSRPQDKASRFYRVREVPATTGP